MFFFFVTLSTQISSINPAKPVVFWSFRYLYENWKLKQQNYGVKLKIGIDEMTQNLKLKLIIFFSSKFAKFDCSCSKTNKFRRSCQHWKFFVDFSMIRVTWEVSSIVWSITSKESQQNCWTDEEFINIFFENLLVIWGTINFKIILSVIC